MSDTILAPWTNDQVLALIWRQTGTLIQGYIKLSPPFHPYTCPQDHKEHIKLIPTPDGWVCGAQNCDYVQNWALASDVEWYYREVGSTNSHDLST